MYDGFRTPAGSVASAPSGGASGMTVSSNWLDGSSCLDSASLRVSTTEAGHEGWLGGAGLDDGVIVRAMHFVW